MKLVLAYAHLKLMLDIPPNAVPSIFRMYSNHGIKVYPHADPTIRFQFRFQRSL